MRRPNWIGFARPDDEGILGVLVLQGEDAVRSFEAIRQCAQARENS